MSLKGSCQLIFGKKGRFGLGLATKRYLTALPSQDKAAWLQRERDNTELLPNVIPLSGVTYRSDFCEYDFLDVASTFGMGHSFQWIPSDTVSFRVGWVGFTLFFACSSKATINCCVASSSLDIGRAACKRHYYFWQLKSFLQCFSADRRLITSCSKILGLLSQTWGLAQVEIAETSCKHWNFLSTFNIFLLSFLLMTENLGTWGEIFPKIFVVLSSGMFGEW